MLRRLKHYFASISDDCSSYLDRLSSLLVPLSSYPCSLQHFEKLYKIIEASKDLLPHDSYLACLKATEQYLNSRDCELRGRYQSTRYWYGVITVTSCTREFKDFNKKLAALIYTVSIAKHPKTITKTHQLSKVSRPSSSTARLVLSLLSSAWANPLTATTRLSLPVCKKNTVSDHSKFMCSSHVLEPAVEQQFFQDYYVFSNVPIECAEYIFLGETHRHQYHQKLQRTYIPHLTRKGDAILLESRKSLQKIPCIKVDQTFRPINLSTQAECFGWDMDAKLLNDSLLSLADKYNKLLAARLAESPQESLKALRVLQKLPDNPVNSRLLTPQELQTIESEYEKDVSNLEYILQQMIGYRLFSVLKSYKLDDFVYGLYYDLFGEKNIKEFESTIHLITDNYIKTNSIPARNALLINTITQLKSSHPTPYLRKLIIAGAAHLFTLPPKKKMTVSTITGKVTRYTDEFNEKEIIENIANWASQADISELREFIEHENYALIYPKVRSM